MYFVDESDHELVHQPDLYRFVAHLARRFGCDTILDLGCGTAGKLVEFAREFRIIGVDYGDNLAFCRRRHSVGEWIELDLEGDAALPISRARLSRTLVVVGDVIEHLVDPTSLLNRMRRLLDHAPAAVLTTPDPDRVRGCDDVGPPINPHHVREWNATELRHLLTLFGFQLSAYGWTRNNDRDGAKHTLAAVCQRPADGPARCPDDFRVVALVATYNEEDIILSSLRHLLDQGIDVHVLDNWSTDDTVGQIRENFGQTVPIERVPSSRVSTHYEWAKILRRKQELSLELEADWFMHCDPDEIRRSPWPGLDLRQAFWKVNQEGFNAVDFTVLNFRPADESFDAGSEMEGQFDFYEWGTSAGHRSQVKAWKKCEGLELVESGGHDVKFPGRRIHPFNFLSQHYPIRSTAQGRMKIRSLLRRIHPDEGERRGWHHQYADLSLAEPLVWDPATLQRYERESFFAENLFERLGRCGVLFPCGTES